jgi:hypothetical protein
LPEQEFLRAGLQPSQLRHQQGKLEEPPMRRKPFFWPIAGLFLVAFFSRIDLWQWHDSRFVLGLPIGLSYQIGFCFVVTVLLAMMLRFGVEISDPTDQGRPSRTGQDKQ